MPTKIDLNEPLIISTLDGSIFRLGKANKKKERSIVCDDIELDFRHCRLFHLLKGDPMSVTILDGKDEGERYQTSRVLSIKQDETN